MKVVLVECPQFGRYLAITVPLVPFGYSTIYVGPDVARAVRMESIHTGKAVVRANTFQEKPCEHKSVSGSITCTAPGFAVASFDAIFSLRQEATTIERVVHRPEVDVYFSCRSEVKTVSGSTGLHCQWTYRGLAEERTIKCVIPLQVTTDPLSGNHTINALLDGAIEVEGIALENLVLAYITNLFGPFNPPSDPLFELIQFLKAEEAKELCQNAGTHKTARDDAIYAAVDNIELAAINWLCDLSDILGIYQVIKQLIKVILGLANWKNILHNLANLRILWVYVVKTNIMTMGEMRKLIRFLRSGGWAGLQRHVQVENLIGHGDSTDRWSRGGISYYQKWTAKVTYAASSEPRENLLSRLSLLGVLPNLGDLWDIVPWSFVVDWAIPVQDYLVRLEQTGLMAQLPLVALVLGRKCVVKARSYVLRQPFLYRLDLVHTYYDRQVTKELPRDMFLGLRFKNPLKQWITASALAVLILKKKKRT